MGVLYAVFSFIDPFGFKTVSAEQSNHLFNRFISGPWYSSAAQNQITVVIVDDDFVRSQEEQWPLSYLTHDWLVDTIASYKPKGLYLDFLYRPRSGQQEELDQFRRTIRRVGAEFPLHLPALIHSKDHDNSCDPNARDRVELDPLDVNPPVVDQDSVFSAVKNNQVSFSYIGWQGCGDQYPSALFQSPKLRTPAFSLFQDVCGQDARYAEGCRTAWASDGFESPFRLTWGTGASALHQQVAEASGVSCVSVPKDNHFGLVKYQLSQLFTWLTQFSSTSTERGTREQCTYTDTLPAGWFVSTRPEVVATVQKLIENRIVLVGARLDGIPDTVYSPVNGSVPGVYLFATALDNYLTFGSETRNQGISKQRIMWEVGFVTVLFFLACGYWRGFIAKNDYIGRSDLESNDVWRILRAAAISRFVIPTVVCGVGISCLWYLDQRPLDWILLISLSFLFTPVYILECFHDRPGFLLTRYLMKRITRN